MAQPKTITERVDVADQCQDDLGLTLPFLIDGIDNRVGNDYSGHPDRLFIVDTSMKVAYSGERGPWGFDPDGMERALAKLVETTEMESARDRALEGKKGSKRD